MWPLITSEMEKQGAVKDFPDAAWLSDLIDYSNSVIHLPVYRRFMEVHKQLEDGLMVIPDRDKYKDLLLEMAHDKAFILLPPHSLFQQLILKREVCRESYFGFYGLCLGRMLVDYLRIPVNSSIGSDSNRPLIPVETDHWGR